MIIIISPAKTIDFSLPFATQKSSAPAFMKEANELAKIMQAYSTSQLMQLMKISEQLAILNYERYQLWNSRNTPKKQALSVFKGEVFNGMKAWEWTQNNLLYAQDHLRILSGLYGVLAPLDLIKAYRLEMGTKINTGSLYSFWGNKISEKINHLSYKNGNTLVNLASKEYSKAINLKQFNGTVITPEFKEMHNGNYRTITIFAKKARGLMTRFIIENRIEHAEDLKAFDVDGYVYNANLSSTDKFIFTRG